MKILVLTIFPELFENFFAASLLGKARQAGHLQLQTLNIRDFAAAPHYKVDDSPYGGGPGMVMRPEPLCAAIRAAKLQLPNAQVVLMSASGKPFNQKRAHSLSAQDELILVCGRYEGVDQRVVELLIDQELCIGDYVLMGGEVAAMAVIEACTRLIPGVLGNQTSVLQESFEAQPLGAQNLEAPQYTRPLEFEGHTVPAVLTSGNHAQILAWRTEQGEAKDCTITPGSSENGAQGGH